MECGELKAVVGSGTLRMENHLPVLKARRLPALNFA